MTRHDILIRLGRGDSITAVSSAAGMTRAQFDAWWRDECRRRVPPATGKRSIPRGAGLTGAVRIERDRWGVPHVYAGRDTDLFFGFGYATAQDRLFQLDYLRRKARGRLAEIVGIDGVESDVLHRTLGLGRIADKEWTALPAEIQNLLGAYTAGINALIDDAADCLPIEFDLLHYRPERWLPTDCLAIVSEFRWYLTGRFPVIVIPELAKRTLGEGPLYQAFLQGEEDAESILFPGEYRGAPGGVQAIGSGGDHDGSGSNNWVLAGSRTTTGKPLVASDPHIPFAAVSLWHEIHLHGSDFQAAGVAQAGMPALMIGRSPHVAWGITNNICSQRDLYQEKTDPAHPGCFLYDGVWEVATTREEIIHVQGAAPIHKVIHFSRNGPIVDEILPAAARATGPVALRWLGFEPCGWLTALIGMNRARTCAEFREASRPWMVPTFNIVFADTLGQIGFQSVGRIPIRSIAERGYRPGWDPRHQWTGLIPFDEMPRLADPPRGFVITANNRVAAEDFPYPLSGTWSMGYRARRIRSQIEPRGPLTLEQNQALQLDTYSGRAARCLPRLVEILEGDSDPRIVQAARSLKAWDGHAEPTSTAPSLFNVFFSHWCQIVAGARFPPEAAALVASSVGGLAADLLDKDVSGWFVGTPSDLAANAEQIRKDMVRTALLRALSELTERLGPDMKLWTWGRLHVLVQKHFLSGRGDLGELLDRSGMPARGDGTSVNCSTSDPNHAAVVGAGYRMVADLADPALGLWATEVAGTSGHPGSPHYDDQIEPWSAGQYHYLDLTGSGDKRAVLVMEPLTS
jgi:penicillin amidase